MLLAGAIGALLGLGVQAFARATASHRDRSFYATVLIVIASYYVLFAVMAGAVSGIVTELAIALAFAALALASFRFGSLVAALGIFAHGIFDLARTPLGLENGAPAWWPTFCGAIDVVLGLSIMIALRRDNQTARQCP